MCREGLRTCLPPYTITIMPNPAKHFNPGAYRILPQVVIPVIFFVLVILLSGRARVISSNSAIPAGTTRTTLPVLAYHAISDDIWGDPSMFIPPDVFRKEMQTLVEKGYASVSLAQLLAPSGPGFPEKPVLITFDDGYRDVVLNAYPVLKKLGLHGIVFIPTDRIGKPRYITSEDMTLTGDFLEFQSHTASHADLTASDKTNVNREFEQSGRVLENLTGKATLAVAYPYGRTNRAVLQAASGFYRYGFITFPGYFREGTDPMRIPRISVTRTFGPVLFRLFIR